MAVHDSGITGLETRRPAQPAATSGEPGALPELEAFLDAVLCDGRCVHTFQDDPFEAAERLGLVLSPQVVQDLSSTPKDKLLARLWEAKFAPRKGDQKNFAFPETLSPDVGIVVIVVAIVVIAAIVIIYTVTHPSRRRQGRVTDRSPDRDDKL